MTVSEFEEIPVWLDCDPGHDDAVAILLAAFSPKFKLLGISASYGNAAPEHTSYNALALVTALGKASDVKVYQGAQKPWIREPVYAADIHGASGLEGSSLLPVPRIELEKESYLDAMERAILEHSGRISLVCTGALTAAATLLRDRPHLKEHIKFISIMGGGINQGNCNPRKSAEFNIWIDPHAADFILRDEDVRHRCILVPLDLTHKAIATADIQDRILGNGCNIRRLFYELFLFFGLCYKNVQGFERGPPVHDPVTLLPLLAFYDPSLAATINFVYTRMDLHVTTELCEDEGKLVGVVPTDTEGSGVMVGFDLNFEFFWQQVYDALAAAESTSTIE
ncbi:AaceriAFR399Wp [[Ashbya] aceris (nom. inval.)]|nr:AaceriAFR399Wp [[Ashbya] aceris (nom. inval.)]